MRQVPTGDTGGYSIDSAKATFIGDRQRFSQEARAILAALRQSGIKILLADGHSRPCAFKASHQGHTPLMRA